MQPRLSSSIRLVLYHYVNTAKEVSNACAYKYTTTKQIEPERRTWTGFEAL